MSTEPPTTYRLTSAIELTGPGIRLREWTDADLPSLVDLFDEVETARWTPLASPFDAEAAREFLTKARQARAEHRSIQLAVTLDGGEPRGVIMLFVGLDGRRDQAELAYTIGAAHRGRGLAAKSVRLMTDYAYRVVGVHAVGLRIPSDNIASIGVARATGFVRTDAPTIVRDRRGSPFTLEMWLHRRLA
ncbi:GNAT family N-acetyltransferase [Embleya scabrispora]|uniref:GNAT family N-acetyltransferase n=1 Tax=Embleya scabrispora TaxID=159449 RepID=UPI000369335C|nr:GNAT family N-acetyltransferase [Embleya scabrispora]MYS86811.1 GNAT family N-acetyltransferase [Streptomyces sp. SID5474]